MRDSYIVEENRSNLLASVLLARIKNQIVVLCAKNRLLVAILRRSSIRKLQKIGVNDGLIVAFVNYQKSNGLEAGMTVSSMLKQLHNGNFEIADILAQHFSGTGASQLIYETYILPEIEKLQEDGLDESIITATKNYISDNGFKHCSLLTQALTKFKENDLSGLASALAQLDDEDFEQTLAEDCPGITRRILEEITQSEQPSPIIERSVQRKDVDWNDPLVLGYFGGQIEHHLGLHQASYQSRQSNFDLNSAPSILIEFKEILDKHKHRFFLSSGTLLGVVRENGFISSDYDIDVGMFANDITPDECADIFRDSSFEVLSKDEFIVPLRHKKTRIDFDIFFYHEDEGMLYHGSEVHKWWTRKFGLTTWDFNGQVFNVPDPVEKVLEDLYGNWRNKVMFYDLSYDCPYRSYNRTLEAIFYVYTRAKRALGRGWRYYSEAGAEGLRDYFGIDVTENLPRFHNTHLVPFPANRNAFFGGEITIIYDKMPGKVDAKLIKRLKSHTTDKGHNILVLKAGGKTPVMSAELLRNLRFLDAVHVVSDRQQYDEIINELNPLEIKDISNARSKAKKVSSKKELAFSGSAIQGAHK